MEFVTILCHKRYAVVTVDRWKVQEMFTFSMLVQYTSALLPIVLKPFLHYNLGLACMYIYMVRVWYCMDITRSYTISVFCVLNTVTTIYGISDNSCIHSSGKCRHTFNVQAIKCVYCV